MTPATAVKLGARGQLLPVRGFFRWRAPLPPTQSAWRSHDGLFVVSSVETAYLPGSGEPPLLGPQWLVSVSRAKQGHDDARCKATADDVSRVVDCFAMPAFDEDNHHPGIARHLWCPIDPAYQQACECKASELTIVDGDYAWTTEPGDCRGCQYERMFGAGYPCPRHGGGS